MIRKDSNISVITKPEWKTILELITFTDVTKVFRIVRKMIITLERMKVPEIFDVMENLNPSLDSSTEIQKHGENWPKPKGSPFNPVDIVQEVFCIADQYLDDEQISNLLKQWISQENLSYLSNVIERRRGSLGEVVTSIRRYMKITEQQNLLSENERTGLTVALIQRLLSENLNYIKIAKNYITIEFFYSILKKVIGPSKGYGKLGGKSAGLVLAKEIIKENAKTNPLLENIDIPNSWFITSDTMYEFIHHNALEEFVFTKYQDPDQIKLEYLFLEYIYKNSFFPDTMIIKIKNVLDQSEGKPLVIRSSSLLEDSFDAAFSGKYKSLFISNIGSKEERLASVLNAIAEVYASTFGPDPIEYRKERGLLDFREEMGILIQEVVGTKIGKYFLPSFAGVAFSHNEFRWSTRIDREDGIIRVVAGLGTRAVDRTMNDYPTLISPGKPGIKLNLSVLDKIRYSQTYLDVINLETNVFETINFDEFIKENYDSYPALDKIVSFNRVSSLVEPISVLADFHKEDLVITFNNLVDRTGFVQQVRDMLNALQNAFTKPVDIEFAHDGQKLYLLQCRPQSSFEKDAAVKIPTDIMPDDIVFTANQYVSTGYVKDIEYIVYVDIHEYSKLKSVLEISEVTRLIGKLNRKLPRKKFILIGPGRWGSKGDIKLGVPVIYSDINNTAMLIEVAKESDGYVPELSFGTHFFQDLVEANIRYLPLYPFNEDVQFNEDFLIKSKNRLLDYSDADKDFTRIIKVIKINDEKENRRLSVYMNGDINRGIACFRKSHKIMA